MSSRAIALGRHSRLADVVSLVLNPSLLTGLFLLGLALTDPRADSHPEFVALLAVVFATAVPLLILIALRRGGRLSDVEMRNRSERGLVYALCAVSYVVGAIVLRLAGAAAPVWGVMLLQAPAAITLWLVNRWYKISIHATAIAGLCVLAVSIFGVRALWLLVVLAAAIWARWAAGAHSGGELLIGALAGGAVAATGLTVLRTLG